MAHRPRLRLILGGLREHSAECKESSLSAASPVGDLLRPCSKSQTACGDNPILLPIAPRVSPLLRKSEIRDDQVFMIPPSVRHPVHTGKRHLVTDVRDNADMAVGASEPDFRTLAGRLKYWVERRKEEKLYGSYKALARACTVSTSHISDLINGHQKSSTKLASIAAALRINAFWLESGKGEALDLKSIPQPPSPSSHLLDLVPDPEVADFSETEIKLLQFKIRESVREIRDMRPKRRMGRTG